MSDWNEEQAAHKAARRGITPLRPVAPSKRKPRKWKVMGFLPFLKKEYVAHRSATEAEALTWIEKQSRSYPMRRQDQSDRARAEGERLAEERASRYRVVAP